jgi:hypothetical protein
MTAPPTTDGGARPHPVGNRRLFWICVAVGWALIVLGIRGVIVDARFTRPPQWSGWFVGAAVFHDLIVAPLVFAVAAIVLRRLRRPYRAPVQAALVMTALVAFATLPVVLQLGEPTMNPTVLPNDATPALLMVLGAIWVMTVLALLRARSRARATKGDPRA